MTMPSVGDPVPPLVRRIDITDMVAYAGATWDWHRLHYDPAYLEAKQLPGPVVDGQLFGAYLIEAVQDWLGPQAFVRRLHFRFVNLVFAGETVRCEGSVTSVDDDVVVLDLRVVVVDDAGVEQRVAVAPAGAEVVARTDETSSS